MANSTPSTSTNAAGDADDRRLLEAPPERCESEPSWIADDLHLLRLVCQITDYEVASTPGDEWILGAAGPAKRAAVPGSPGPPPP
jgi:hypothetical protein